MKRIYFFIVLTFVVSNLSAQELRITTTRFIGGDATCGFTSIRSAIKTRDGGILLVGATNCWGGGDIPVNPEDSFSTKANVLIVKIDNNMQISWVKVYGGSRTDIGVTACELPDGGYGILSLTQSVDRDVTGNHSILGVDDIWLVKIDSLGNLLWQKCYGGPYDETPMSISTTPDNGFVLLGVTNGPGGDVPFCYNTDSYDWFIVKTDSNGNKEWSNTLGGTGDEYSFGSILLADTGYYLLSGSTSTDHDCTDDSWHIGISTVSDYYIIKLDTSGHREWSKSFGGSLSEGCNYAFWDSNDTSIVMVGSSYSKDYMVTGHKGAGSNAWVVKADRNGNLKWQTSLGKYSNYGNQGVSMVKGPHNGYIVLSQLDSGTIRLTDSWLFLLDSAGNKQADKVFGGQQHDIPKSVISYKDGFAAIGFTPSLSFTEGANFGRISNNEDAFISYINYWPLALKNIENKKEYLQLIPNPAHNEVRIMTSFGRGTLRIINMAGQLIHTQRVRAQSEYIDINVATWPKGNYTVTLTDDNGKFASSSLIIN